MAAGEPTRQDPSGPKVLAAQTRGDSRPFFAGGQIKGLSAAWTRSWQLLESTLWSCWLVTELFSSSSHVGRGLFGAVESDSDKMHDVCDASLYKKLIVPASNDIREPENVLN